MSWSISAVRPYSFSGICNFEAISWCAKRNTLYTGIEQALTQWTRNILSEGPTSITRWRKKLLKILGPNGGIVTEIIPAIKAIIGEQPAPPELGPGETQNRFKLLFVNFLQALATKENPLVIFLDDLQWADPSSLHLLNLLLTSPETKYILIIGAYRDNEIDQAHILMLALEELNKAKVKIKTFHLDGLSEQSVFQLLSDTLRLPVDEIQALGKLCYQKTHGNPFFLNQLLLTLYHENLIVLDMQQGKWTYDIPQIKAKEVSDNVVELMTSKLYQLNKNTLIILQLAACIGNHFDLNTLACTYEKTPVETLADLRAALNEQLVIPENQAYKYAYDIHSLEEISLRDITYHFLHDHVQHAAYLSLPSEKREAIHHRIGEIMLANTPKETLHEHILTIVNQLNAGKKLITAPDRIMQLVELNVMAGQRAKETAAFRAAVDFFQVARDLLFGDYWKEHYELTMKISQLLADCLYISARFDEAEEIIKEMLGFAKTPLEKANILCSKVIQYTCAGKLEEAITHGLEGLKLLGMNIPSHPSKFQIIKEAVLAKWNLGSRKILDLINSPDIKDLKINRILTLLNEIRPCAFATSRTNLVAIVILKAVNLALTHGNSPEAAITYSGYAGLLGAKLGDTRNGPEFARLSILLNEKYHDLANRSKIYCLYALFSHPWNQHWKTIKQNCDIAIEAGLQNGDLFYTAQSAVHAPIWDPEMPLETSLEGSKLYLKIILQTQYIDAWANLKMAMQYRANLCGKTLDKFSFSDETFNEEEQLQRLFLHKYHIGITAYYVRKSMMYYMYESYPDAMTWLQKADANMDALMGMASCAEHCFYSFLIRAALFPHMNWQEKMICFYKMKKSYKQMKKWTKHCPINFLPKQLLMGAEFARLFNYTKKAATLYAAAIKAAKNNEYLTVEALANELAAKFYLSQGQETIAQLFMQEACYGYGQWGAKLKIQHLELNYPQLLKEEKLEKETRPETTRTQTTSLHSFDFNSALKSSLAISGEIVLSDLLIKLMRIVIENAGAEHGWFILKENEKWFIEAEGGIETEVKTLQSQPINVLPLSIINTVIYEKKPLIIKNASRSSQYLSDSYIQRNQTKSILCMPLLKQGETIGLLYLENNLVENAFTANRLQVLNLLASQIVISVENARLYKKTTELNESLSNLNIAYGRFVPKQFLELLGKKSITDVVAGDSTQKDMTVLFSDIRNFTSISEKMNPQENFLFINTFLNYMTPLISKNKGFVDKFFGDGIMALFPTTADAALLSAIDMLNAIDKFNVQQGYNIRIGIGLNSGLMMIGTVGDDQRMDGTVISDTVNISSRVEDLTKKYGVNLLITEETLSRLANPKRYLTRKIDTVLVKGKANTITIYEVFETDSPLQQKLKLQTLSDFQKAVNLYHNNQIIEAISYFRKIVDLNNEDGPAAFYLARCLEMQEELSLNKIQLLSTKMPRKIYP